MFLHEATYDLDELARFNLHCHTHYSNCAKREMTVENIIKEAERCGLEMLSLNDHILFPDELEQHSENNEQLRKEVEATGTKIKVLIGGEKKAKAIKAMVSGEITPQIPCSILNEHKDVIIMLDKAAASLID